MRTWITRQRIGLAVGLALMLVFGGPAVATEDGVRVAQGPPATLPTAENMLVTVDPVAIYADGTDSTTIRVYAVPGLTNMVARLTEGDAVLSDLPLFDNGMHGDAVAADGIYTGVGVTLQRAITHNGGRHTQIRVTALHDQSAEEGLPSSQDFGLVAPGERVAVTDLGDGILVSTHALVLLDPTFDLSPPQPVFGDPATDAKNAVIDAGTRRILERFPDVFDWTAFTSRIRGFPNWSEIALERNPVAGIGIPIVSDLNLNTSSSQLRATVAFELGVPENVLVHEIFHTWVFGIEQSPLVSPPHPLSDGQNHYGQDTDVENFMCCGSAAELMDGQWFAAEVDDTQAHPLTLYLAGLGRASDVPDVHIFENMDEGLDGALQFENLETFTVAEIQALLGGPRAPAFGDAPTDFRIALAFYSQVMPTPAEWAYFDLSAQHFAVANAYDNIGQVPFRHAVRDRATITTALPEPLVAGTPLGTDGDAPGALPLGTQAAQLQPGWNLVGWTGATLVNDALASIAGQFDAVFTWDAVGQAFRSFRPALPGPLNSLDEFEHGDGVWIFVTDTEGARWEQPAITDPRAVPLERGFNLVMWTGPDATPVEEAAAEIAGNLEGLWIWDATAQRFLSYAPTALPFLNSAETLDHGDGVWVRMTHAMTWNQPAAVEEPAPPFTLTSEAFDANATIPLLYTCDGANISPPLALSGIPSGTQTLAMIMDDPDAPDGTWVHWVAFNIPPTPAIAADVSALGTAGVNSWGLLGYGGPCPPSGTHRYIFTVYALNTTLSLAEGASKEEVLAAMDGQLLASAEWIGLFR